MTDRSVRTQTIVDLVFDLVREIEDLADHVDPAQVLDQLEDMAERRAREIGRLALQRGLDHYRACA